MGTGAEGLDLEANQTTFKTLLYGVGLAIVLTLLLKDTGPAAERAVPVSAEIRP